MVVEFRDAVAATPVYVNPNYVVTVRPDAKHPDEVTILKMRDGEVLSIRGDHRAAAEKLRQAG